MWWLDICLGVCLSLYTAILLIVGARVCILFVYILADCWAHECVVYNMRNAYIYCFIECGVRSCYTNHFSKTLFGNARHNRKKFNRLSNSYSSLRNQHTACKERENRKHVVGADAECSEPETGGRRTSKLKHSILWLFNRKVSNRLRDAITASYLQPLCVCCTRAKDFRAHARDKQSMCVFCVEIVKRWASVHIYAMPCHILISIHFFPYCFSIVILCAVPYIYLYVILVTIYYGTDNSKIIYPLFALTRTGARARRDGYIYINVQTHVE